MNNNKNIDNDRNFDEPWKVAYLFLAYELEKYPSKEKIQKLSKQIDESTHKVDKWFTRTRTRDMNRMKKYNKLIQPKPEATGHLKEQYDHVQPELLHLINTETSMVELRIIALRLLTDIKNLKEENLFLRQEVEKQLPIPLPDYPENENEDVNGSNEYLKNRLKYIYESVPPNSKKRGRKSHSQSGKLDRKKSAKDDSKVSKNKDNDAKLKKDEEEEANEDHTKEGEEEEADEKNAKEEEADDEDNNQKRKKQKVAEKLYCHCNKKKEELGEMDEMIKCTAKLDGCKEWYHVKCLGGLAPTRNQISNAWICSACDEKIKDSSLYRSAYSMPDTNVFEEIAKNLKEKPNSNTIEEEDNNKDDDDDNNNNDNDNDNDDLEDSNWYIKYVDVDNMRIGLTRNEQYELIEYNEHKIILQRKRHS